MTAQPAALPPDPRRGRPVRGGEGMTTYLIPTTLEMHDTGGDAASVATISVRPEYGRPVTFTVTYRRVKVPSRSWYSRTTDRLTWVVGLKGSTGDGFSTHSTYDAALKSALIRARRYHRAYSVPRGVAS